VWAALAGSLVFWGLRLLARPGAVPAQVQTVAIDQAVRGDVLRLLGAVAPAGGAAAPPPPPAAARFKLVGAVASTGGGAGWAVLSWMTSRRGSCGWVACSTASGWCRR
jgi:general secretion pathway protein C